MEFPATFAVRLTSLFAANKAPWSPSVKYTRVTTLFRPGSTAAIRTSDFPAPFPAAFQKLVLFRGPKDRGKRRHTYWGFPCLCMRPTACLRLQNTEVTEQTSEYPEPCCGECLPAGSYGIILFTTSRMKLLDYSTMPHPAVVVFS